MLSVRNIGQEVAKDGQKKRSKDYFRQVTWAKEFSPKREVSVKL